MRINFKFYPPVGGDCLGSDLSSSPYQPFGVWRVMRVKTNKLQFNSHGMYGMEAKGDVLLFNHAQNIEPDLEFCYNMRNTDGNGFSDKRQQRHIGRVPDIIFCMHPEWNDHPEEVAKWLNTEEGKPFRTVNGGI